MTSKVSLEDLLAHFRGGYATVRDLGTSFEDFIKSYLQTDPQYADRLQNVWHWKDWPYRWATADRGIDLVAQESNGDYWAVQCKFYEPTSRVERRDIDSFLAESGHRFSTADGIQKAFSSRLIVSTTDNWGPNAEAALDNQDIPVSRIGLPDLAAAPINWEQFLPGDLSTLTRRLLKTPREHQIAAIEDVVRGFESHDRGKLIMACGSGKTFTALRLAEKIVPKVAARVLFLAPSISLVSQALREWTAEAAEPINSFVVCSDSKIGRDHEDIRPHDLAYPPTTDPHKLYEALAAAANRPTVVFATYQSIRVIEWTQDLGLPAFDLIICDEAHRTAGLTLPGDDPSNFTLVHDSKRIRGNRRLYMTATPRIYADASKSKADERSATLYSMDDEAIYGPVFHRLGFAKAVAQDLLSDYKVVIVAVDEDRVADLTNSYNQAFAISKKEAITTDLATKIIGSWNGLSSRNVIEIDDAGRATQVNKGQPMRRAIAFSQSIQRSTDISNVFSSLTELYHTGSQSTEALVRCRVQHVDGSMNSLIRQQKLSWLEAAEADGACRILSNARCLSEGINVPTLDAVIFFDTRDSIVDIVQSVGRVMRKSEGKEYGYIILPVCVPRNDIAEYQAYIESDKQFKGIWKVIKALRAHDESLVDEAEFRRKIKIISGRSKTGDRGDHFDDPTLELPMIDVEALSEAVYAAIPKKLGDREYWSEWASTIAPIAKHVGARIEAIIAAGTGRASFENYLKGLHENINPGVTESDAIDMLTQHLITRPIFESIFQDYNFVQNNPISRAMQNVLTLLDENAVTSETSDLERFYDNVRERVAYAKSPKSKQDVIRNLYDTFFRGAFPNLAKRLGIVYTPVEVVDFIINSVDVALRMHFGRGIGDKNIHVIDPFAGTGTFIVRLIQSGLISSAELEHKYSSELHANEIVLLAYYIAAINIESSYLAASGTHKPFEGIVLTDTFQSYGAEQGVLSDGFSRENNVRLRKQRATPIRVVISNPPYSAGQKSANDNNSQQPYPELEARVKATYAAQSISRTKKMALYTSEILALRWASDRIGSDGIVAFVTNGSFIESNSMDGLRKCFNDDFKHLYIFNCRGHLRGTVEQQRIEGTNIFGQGSMNTVAVVIAVKDAASKDHTISYYDIGDGLSGKQKLEEIERLHDIADIHWTPLNPNKNYDWINQRDVSYQSFTPLGDKQNGTSALFSTYSPGIITNRDPWAYNFSSSELRRSISLLIDTYNSETERYGEVKPMTKPPPEPKDIVNRDPKRIKWDGKLFDAAEKGKRLSFDPSRIVTSAYRPFTKEHLYYDGILNWSHSQMPKMFPTRSHPNLVICLTGAISGRQTIFSALITDCIPNRHLIDSCQCFPLYTYSKADQNKLELLDPGSNADEFGYVRSSAIDSEAVSTYRLKYSDSTITDEDIFYHIYGVLHAIDYRNKYRSELRKVLARVPQPDDFWAFSTAGRNLADLHLKYETVEPWPLVEMTGFGEPDYTLRKMRFRSKGDRSAIIFNEHLTLEGIPQEAHDYVIGGWSAIKWIMERYEDHTDKVSGIRNNPNLWASDPRHIVDLVKRIVRVSVETMRIVNSLPPAVPSI